MKKLVSILLTLAVAVSLCLVTAVPVAAVPGGPHETNDYFLPWSENCGFDHIQMLADTEGAFLTPVAFEVGGQDEGFGTMPGDWNPDDYSSWSQTYNDGTLVIIDGNKVDLEDKLYCYIHFSGPDAVLFHYQAWDGETLVLNQDWVKEEGGWWATPASDETLGGTWETPRLSPAEVKVDAPGQVAPGVSFTAKVDPTLVDFDACNYDVVFNSAVLELTGVTAGKIGETPIPVTYWNKIEDGRYRVVQNVPGTPGVTGSGYLAKLWFTVIGSDGQSSNIALEDGCLSDKNAQEIPAIWTSATVNIVKLDADFTVTGESSTTSPAEGYVGTTSFEFTDKTTGGTAPYTYAWNFGDGKTGTGATPTHSYAAAGTYEVSLTVKDTWKGTNTETKTDCVKVYDTLAADFSGAPTKGIKGSTLHPATVQFIDGSTGGKRAGSQPYYQSYEWDFGDGTSPGTIYNPSNTYAPAGLKTGLKYTVSLTVTDALGGTDTESKADYITIYQMGDINADLTVDSADITKIERIVAGRVTPTFTADANEDGKINALDITKTELLVLAAV